MNLLDIFNPPELQKKEPIILPAIPVPESLKDWYSKVQKVLEKKRLTGEY